METRLRLQLLKARLPTPCVQADLHDAEGGFLGRADLYYPDRRLVIEYDGENHRDRLVSDLRRQNALVNAGYHVLRFTARDLRNGRAVPDEVRIARSRISDRPDNASLDACQNPDGPDDPRDQGPVLFVKGARTRKTRPMFRSG